MKRQLVGFKSLWLGLRVRAFGQGLGPSFSFSGSLFRVICSSLQTRSC